MTLHGFTDHELARIAVQRLDELAHVLASINVRYVPDRPSTLFTVARHHLEALRRTIGDLDQYAICDELRRPLVWRVAPAGDGLPAALIAERPGLGTVSVALNPDLVDLSSGWHYLTGIARKMTEALS